MAPPLRPLPETVVMLAHWGVDARFGYKQSAVELMQRHQPLGDFPGVATIKKGVCYVH